MNLHLPGGTLFAKLRRARDGLRLIETHVPDYLRVFHSDLNHFRQELLETMVGFGIAIFASLLCIALLSEAVIISAWNTHLRIAAAWSVAGVWAALSCFGVALAIRALRGPAPFSNSISVILNDLRVYREHL